MINEIKRLQIFAAIAETGSFTLAAERLRMAQPWVSIQLKQLEEQLGFSLVARSKGRLLGLTPEGRELLPVATDLLACCTAAQKEAHRLRDRSRSRVVLGVDPITLYFPQRNDLVARFMEKAKTRNVDFEIVSGTPAEVLDSFENGRLDVILTSCLTPAQDVDIMPLYEHELYLAVPKTGIGKYESTKGGSLSGVELLTLPDSYYPTGLGHLRKSLAAENVKWITCPESSFPALIRYANLLGLAIIIPDLSASISEIQTEMVVRPVKNSMLRFQWSLMRRRGARRRAVDMFWALAAESAPIARAA